jgi:NodT family efflux transporter outer membrane factor (OMF) lipoprotein
VQRHDRDLHAMSRGRPALAAAALLCVALTLPGCAVGPKFVKPVETTNTSWSEQADPRTTQTVPDSLWWRAFHDATLDSLIRTAYHHNLSLQIAGLRIYEARAQLGIALGQRWPQLQFAFGSATAVGLSKHAANSVLADHNFWDYQAGFDAQWELDFWRRLGENVHAEEATYESAIAEYDDALVSLVAEVARTYAIIRTFEVLVDLSRKNEALQADGLRIAQSRFKNGATSELDVSQASTLLENTRSSIPQLESSQKEAENALCTLLGQPTGSLDSLLRRTSGIPSAPGPAAVGVPAEMLRRRPDIRSAELQAEAQCARIGVAKADLYPRFLLAGSIGTQTSSSGGPLSGNSTFSDIFGPSSWFYTFGPSIIWPILNYGRISNNVRVQDARLQQLLDAYQNTVLRAAQEVEDGLSGLLRFQEATGFAQNAVNSAQRSVDLALIQYREGATDYQRVLDAERSLLAEENGLVRTQSAVATNLISVYKALGGGWEMREGRPFVSDSTRIEMKNRTNWGDYLEPPQNSQHSNGSSGTPR